MKSLTVPVDDDDIFPEIEIISYVSYLELSICREKSGRVLL